MISSDFIKKLATRYQTTELNTQREYLQHLFLSSFYQEPSSKNILFKGGTALKFLYNSPRFSEDLDFSGFKIKKKEIERLLLRTLSQIEKESIKVDINEAKTTSGGYLAIYRGEILKREIKIQLQISFRQKKRIKQESALITQDFISPYTILHLSEGQLTAEKIEALLEREKARDWYDLYFILRSRLEIDFDFLKMKREALRNKILGRIKSLQTSHLKKELKPLLPISHHYILKNFREKLTKEVKRYL